MEQSSRLEESRFSEDPPPNQDHPARGEEHNDDLRGRVGQRVIHQTLQRMTVEPEAIFWTIDGNCICRHLCRKENHSQIHCDFFDVGQENKFYLVTCCWKAVLAILGTLMVSCFAPVSRSSQKTSPDGCTWSGGRLTKNQATSRPDCLWPGIWSGMAKEKLAVGC